jgi:REP element-mobilizing transposase RayT
MDMPYSRRHPPHFPPVDQYNRSTIIFLTVCTRKRQSLLANETTHAALRKAWTEAGAWAVGRYVILPDHVHLFCAPAVEPAQDIHRWVGYWKRLASKLLGHGQLNQLWQRDFWDTQLRRGESYASKWEYVRENPVRHGLAVRSEDWPFQGEIRILEWHD